MANSESESRLARRYAIELPVEIESPGSPAAVHATRDISHRGVFVCTDHPLPANSPVQFTMTLNTGEDEGEVRVTCSGTVVRVESLDGRDIGMAATIDSYQFLHNKPANA